MLNGPPVALGDRNTFSGRLAMDFLYLGKESNKVTLLKEAMSRSNIGIYAIMSPEATYFKILTENVTAVFLELENVPFDSSE